jgi:hypothetical protein
LVTNPVTPPSSPRHPVSRIALQEPSEALAAKTAHLKEKLAKLASEALGEDAADAEPSFEREAYSFMRLLPGC